MGKGGEPQITLKSDQRTILLELGLGGKFQAKSNGWNENRVFLEGDNLEVAVNNGRWVLTNLPAGPRPKAPTIFRPRSDAVTPHVTAQQAGNV
jgi:hypothetical protein